MAVDLNAILSQIGRDKGIDKTILIEAIESAMLSAARKHFGEEADIEFIIEPGDDGSGR